MRRLLLHPLYPLVFQIAALFLLGISLWHLFTGPLNAEYNLGSYLIWHLWWAALPLSFVLVGRMWCAVCPVGFLSQKLQRIASWAVRWPTTLAQYEIAILTLSILAVHFLNLWFNFEEDLAAGRTFVVVLVLVALLTALVFRQGVWCRSLCPVGALGAFMSRISTLQMRKRPAACRQCSTTPCRPTRHSRSICPLRENPRSGLDTRFCSLCGECAKVCPHAAYVPVWNARLEWNGKDVFSLQTALASLVLLGLALDMACKQLTDWPIYFWKMTSAVGVAPTPWLEILIHALFVSFPLLLLGGLSAATKRTHSLAYNLVDLSRLLLPLGALAIAAVGLHHLVLIGPQNLKGILLSAGYEQIRWLGATRYLEGTPLMILQWVLVGLGLYLGLRTLRHIRATGVDPGSRMPFVIAGALSCTAFSLLFLWIFSQPMIH